MNPSAVPKWGRNPDVGLSHSGSNFNFHVHLDREYSDRVCTVASIPMYTPQEAIDELDHAVGRLGHKVIMIPAGVPRPIPALHERVPEAFPDAHWMDYFGVDSEHDYDPFWSRCVELGVAGQAEVMATFDRGGRAC